MIRYSGLLLWATLYMPFTRKRRLVEKKL